MFALTSAASRQVKQAARVDADGSMQCGMGFDGAKDADMKLDLDGFTVVIAGDGGCGGGQGELH